MKNLALISLSLIFSASAFAKANPQYTALSNVSAVGNYIHENMEEIISSSIELAKEQAPDMHYFLVTKKVEIDAEKATANIYMTDNNLECVRQIESIPAEESLDKFDDNALPTFSLASTIKCNINPSIVPTSTN